MQIVYHFLILTLVLNIFCFISLKTFLITSTRSYCEGKMFLHNFRVLSSYKWFELSDDHLVFNLTVKYHETRETLDHSRPTCCLLTGKTYLIGSFLLMITVLFQCSISDHLQINFFIVTPLGERLYSSDVCSTV